MKVKYLKYSYIVALIALFTVGCSDSDEVFDQITDEVTRGAILRTVNVLSNSVAINSSTNVLESDGFFGVVLEYQDDEDGALLSQMDVFVGYIDNTDDGVDNSRGDVLVESVTPDQFGVSENNLPLIEYNITAQEMQTAVELSNDQLGLGGDRFAVRFEVVLTDGRSFSNDDNSGTITGSYFASPFLYNVNVVCAPSMPTAGTWMVDAEDTFGDGWNGGFLTIVLDGQEAATISNVDGGPNLQPLMKRFYLQLHRLMEM